MIPKKIFLTTGHGTHRHRLQSFELALRDAEVAPCNLVNVSSIVPPHCKQINKKEGISLINPGEITYCVLSKIHTKKPKKIGASVGLAIPELSNEYGYIAEYQNEEMAKTQLKKTVEDLAILMLATTKGMTDKKNGQQVPLSDKDIIDQFQDKMKTKSIADTVNHSDPELWSTVVALAVFIE